MPTYKSLFQEDHKQLVKKIPEDYFITKHIFSIDLISDECRSLNCVITAIYKIDKSDDKIKIFGENFVKNNKDKCFMIYEDQQLEISEYLETKNLKDKEKLEIKITGLGEITDISYLFDLNELVIFLLVLNKNYHISMNLMIFFNKIFSKFFYFIIFKLLHSSLIKSIEKISFVIKESSGIFLTNSL